MTDSIRVGEIQSFSLTFRYPKDQQVVFPDSTFDFAPFEFSKKEYFPTKSGEKYSYDSAVYYLSTFEVDSIQYLSLPVFMLSGKDSMDIYSNVDSVVFKGEVAQLPDSLVFKEKTIYRPVTKQFNYPYLFIGLGVVVFLALLILIIFGKKIRKSLKIYRLNKAYQLFVREFDEKIEELRQEPGAELSEGGLKYWKLYMEKLEKRPYTKNTTKEIIHMESNDLLSEPLKAIDRSIYSRHKDENLHISFGQLKDFTSQKYHQRKEEIINA
ncbi:hypothetical protein E1171_17960 [Cytophagales bacterium RKSG123]|nr:hypothetical protein [Xanthovirga aplysinae]